MILLPLGCLTGLSVAQMECILLHELAHVARHDYLVNLLQSLVEGLLFYHPAVWWVSRAVRTERENCCDDRVVELMGDARAYAATLATLEQRRALVPESALAATGGNLMKRIRRLTVDSRVLRWPRPSRPPYCW
ncbi:MAG: M56 family metallopeptidase [Ignavibacteriota bacterium]